MGSRDNETPAVITFGRDVGDIEEDLPPVFNDGDGNDQFSDQFDEDMEAEVDRSSKEKGGGNARMILWIAIAFLVVMICLGGYVVYSVMQKKNANTVVEEVFVPPQPELLESTPLPRAVQPPMRAAPVVPATQPLIQQQLHPLPNVIVPPGVAAPSAAQDSPHSLVTASTSVPSPSSSVSISVSKEALDKLEAKQQALEKRIVQLEALIHAQNSDSKEENKRSVPVVKGRPQGAVRPAVKKTAAAKPVMKKTDAAMAPKAPVSEFIVPSQTERSQYRISAIVNNRAFVIKRSPDGTEIEQSISVGEKIDGHIVTRVDARKREIVVEGGQHITADRFTGY